MTLSNHRLDRYALALPRRWGNDDPKLNPIANAYRAEFEDPCCDSPRGNRQISIAGPGDSKVNLDLNNVTAAEVLDALALGSNRKVWVVAFADDPSLTTLPPKGMRRTTSLWTDNLVPDNIQPTWSFFRWGDPMPPRRTK
jgi:hypothetical protein